MDTKENPQGAPAAPAVPPVSDEGVFSAGGEGRIEETKWLQERTAQAPAPRESESQELDRKARGYISVFREQMTPRNREGGEPISPLREYIEGLDRDMHNMRMGGISTLKRKLEYETLRKSITQSLEKESALKHRLNLIANEESASPFSGVSDEVRQEAVRTFEETLAEQEKLENAYGNALRQHNEWVEVGRDLFRRRTDKGPWQPERRLPPHAFDEQITTLTEEVIGIEDEVAALKNPAPEIFAAIRARIDNIKARQHALGVAANLPAEAGAGDSRADGEAEAEAVENYPAVSRENAVLVQLLDRLTENITRMSPALESDWVAEATTPPEENLPELELVATPEDEYDAQVEGYIREVRTWEKVVDALDRGGKLTQDVRTELLGEIRKYPTQLFELDEKLSTEGRDPGQSVARRRLVDELTELRARLTDTGAQQRPADEFHIREDQPAPKPSKVEVRPIVGDSHGFIAEEKPDTRAATAGSLKDMHRRIKASYAAVQHRLGDEQRRDIRKQLAQFTALVRRTELEGAVAHATEHAPALAHATLASMPRAPKRFVVRTLSVAPVPVSKPSRGVWTVLGDAFRLK